MKTISASFDNVPFQYLMLHGRHPVLQELTDLVLHQMDDMQAWLGIGRWYAASDLMGAAFWKLLTRDEKRLCGSVISHLVLHGEWPLMKREKRSASEANSYVAAPDAEAWLLSQLGICAAFAPAALLAPRGAAIAMPKE